MIQMTENGNVGGHNSISDGVLYDSKIGEDVDRIQNALYLLSMPQPRPGYS